MKVTANGTEFDTRLEGPDGAHSCKPVDLIDDHKAGPAVCCRRVEFGKGKRHSRFQIIREVSGCHGISLLRHIAARVQ